VGLRDCHIHSVVHKSRRRPDHRVVSNARSRESTPPLVEPEPSLEELRSAVLPASPVVPVARPSLAEGGTDQAPKRRRNGLAKFRAVEPEVCAGLRAGRTLVAIYAETHSRLGMSYAQFARYASSLRVGAKKDPSLSVVPFRRSETPPGRSTGSAASRPGPARGEPENAIPTLNVDRFATQALANEDLI
jgi:hypothetical protein